MLLMMLTATGANAQYDPYFAHYYDMQTSFNPAAAGKDKKLNIAAAYAMTMAGFENAPKTFYASGDMPIAFLNGVNGVGVQLMSDQLGLFTHQRLAAQYDRQMKLLGGKLAIGLNMGILNEKFKGSEVDLREDSDPVFDTKTDIDGNALDLGFGLYYKRANWYVGLSALHITSPTVRMGEKNQYKIDAMFYLNGGADFQLRNPNWKIATSAIVRTEGKSYRGDITGRLIYTHEKRILYGGVTYSPTNSVTVLAGGVISGVMIGYSFEMYTNGISIRNGSHELFLGYQMDVNLGKKGKNFHQTTRTL